MFRITIVFGGLVLLTLFHAQMVNVRGGYDPGSCSRSNHGDLTLVKDRENRDILLVCTESNGAYNWKTTDMNSKPSGEYFDPGYDCLDILNKNTKAKDGYYWVDFHQGKPRKVYCDMTTDGGGYMLFGHMNDTVTWDVPSSNQTVETFGYPHWSSEFGDVPVLDFRIQIASDDNFENTKAHWAFRFKNKRPMKNLMILHRGGCPYHSPGVGDVSYVKDLMTEEIVTKDFSCSIFGPYSNPILKFGWTMMNLCLEKPCPKGFAYHPSYSDQFDFSGGFSYVIKANHSNPNNIGATTFFGCDKGKCCACYGPPGGRDVYCFKECQATNGGTITKNASAWFWVRANPPRPRKVWEKCMEYKSEDENGDSAWYKLVGDRNIPVKGRCGNSEPLLNDGVVVVEDSGSLKNIPPVVGLLAYQKDNQSLHVLMNDTWKALAVEEKITDQFEVALKNVQVVENASNINEQLARINERLGKVDTVLASITSNSSSSSQVHSNHSGWKLVARFSNLDGKHWISDATFWYDKTTNYGSTLDASHNQDMISEAFWRLKGYEIKITRSDDPTHTALLQTTNNCLKGKTFRQFITSFGNFRKGRVWANNKCLSSCEIKYGGQYQSTTGFEMHSCNGNIQDGNYIGFWCQWDGGDGAVMMIGGGGSACGRADHGMGITEEDAAKFGGSESFLDFGYEPAQGAHYNESKAQKSYALNLWVADQAEFKNVEVFEDVSKINEQFTGINKRLGKVDVVLASLKSESSKSMKISEDVSKINEQLTRVNERLGKVDVVLASIISKSSASMKISENVSNINEQLERINERLGKVEKNVQVVLPSTDNCTTIGSMKPVLSGWTHIARFSNSDGKNWMKDAKFWYDQMSNYGSILDPSYNQDMISEAFWTTSANEIKITRSDDPRHTALLETTNNCLQGNTFRQFITSFGNFRNGAVWASDKCLSSCAIKYGGQYQNTTGFGMYSCNGNIQDGNYIGFWCDWSSGDGAVMMIGGGGSACGRADHGIGITEEPEGKFGGTIDSLDFGYELAQVDEYDESKAQKSYALNLWVR